MDNRFDDDRQVTGNSEDGYKFIVVLLMIFVILYIIFDVIFV